MEEYNIHSYINTATKSVSDIKKYKIQVSALIPDQNEVNYFGLISKEEHNKLQ